MSKRKTTFYKDENGDWRWRIKSGRRIIGAATEGYKNKQDARANYFDQGIYMFQQIIGIIAPNMSDAKLKEMFVKYKGPMILFFILAVTFISCKLVTFPEIETNTIEMKAAPTITTNNIAIDSLKQNYWQDPEGNLHQGGLYPGGVNVPPTSHANKIQKATNKLTGTVGVVTIGASNCMYEGNEFAQLVDSFSRVRFVNAAIGGKSLEKILMANYWTQVHNKIIGAWLSNSDVQIVILESSSFDGAIDSGFVNYTNYVTGLLIDVCQKILFEFPKCQIIYVPSIVSTQYAMLPEYEKFAEPWAYYTGWAYKFLIDKQIAGDPELISQGPTKTAPVIAWMNPNWSDGITENTFGFSWEIGDVFPAYPGAIENGVHPSIIGAQKVANYWYSFFENNYYTSNWFY